MATGRFDGAAGTAGTTEDDLVRRAQEGESRAFELLYQKYVGRVYALCLRMTSNPTQSEDLTQDVFVQVWKKIGSFEFKSAFATWLHRVAANVTLGFLRSTGKRDQSVVDLDVETFEDELRDALPETRMDLERAIALLPPGAKETLILHDVEGYRYREIAEMLGVAEGTVKSQLSRARRLVREAL